VTIQGWQFQLPVAGILSLLSVGLLCVSFEPQPHCQFHWLFDSTAISECASAFEPPVWQQAAFCDFLPTLIPGLLISILWPFEMTWASTLPIALISYLLSTIQFGHWLNLGHKREKILSLHVDCYAIED
jgi:hypothetical protein